MKRTPLLPGEMPIENAPSIALTDSVECVPQHYLHYDHTLESVEAVIERISFDESYPIFIGEEKGTTYIQIGIIGRDNYKKSSQQKIVYGRRWRVEANLPTSEIIQTTFLAIKKAREHEVRELLTLEFGGVKTTPFNSHHDLPLMAYLGDSIKGDKKCQDMSRTLNDIIGSVKYDGVVYGVSQVHKLNNGLWVISLTTSTAQQDYLNIFGQGLTFTSPNLSHRDILHNLMSELIRKSDRYVEETFAFDGFNRFSHALDPFQISRLSAQVRKCPSATIQDPDEYEAFVKTFKTTNYETDLDRIPAVKRTPYVDSLKQKLLKRGVTFE